MEKAESSSNGSLDKEEIEPVIILIVEDDPANQWLVTSTLEGKGYKLKYAVNGKEAVEMVSKGSFDIVIMDLGLPVMNGIQATTIIRNKEVGTGRRIPIIALSALDWDGDKKRGFNAGVDGFLSKPVNSKKLLSEIKRYLPRAGEFGQSVEKL